MKDLRDLRHKLDRVLADGLPPIKQVRDEEDAIDHARVMADCAAILEEAFDRKDLRCIVVGGSAVIGQK